MLIRNCFFISFLSSALSFVVPAHKNEETPKFTMNQQTAFWLDCGNS
jgi:hypothetical protein